MSASKSLLAAAVVLVGGLLTMGWWVTGVPAWPWATETVQTPWTLVDVDDTQVTIDVEVPRCSRYDFATVGADVVGVEIRTFVDQRSGGCAGPHQTVRDVVDVDGATDPLRGCMPADSNHDCRT